MNRRERKAATNRDYVKAQWYKLDTMRRSVARESRILVELARGNWGPIVWESASLYRGYGDV